MAHTTQDRARTATGERDIARENLEGAFAERDHCRRRYESAIGTSCEMSAYMRLRSASDRVAALDKWLRWVESDDALHAPRPDHTPLDGLLLTH
jgi:hypothetical protein